MVTVEFSAPIGQHQLCRRIFPTAAELPMALYNARLQRAFGDEKAFDDIFTFDFQQTIPGLIARRAMNSVITHAGKTFAPPAPTISRSNNSAHRLIAPSRICTVFPRIAKYRWVKQCRGRISAAATASSRIKTVA